ncbi:MAG: glycosyltransferase family 39 protein [Thermoleophilia bacterium]|nr:glycosyltransferase family 39 protein [Thermoleophilia bacterium]
MSTRPDPRARPDPLGNRLRRAARDLRRSTTHDRALTAAGVGALMLLGGLMRAWALGGLSFAYGADDARYVAVAQNLAGGVLPDGDAEWFGARVVLLWPVALIFRLIGANDVHAIAWPFACSLISILATFLIGRELASRRVALVAAGIVAVAPLEAIWATHLRPDAIMPAFIALSIWAALRARRSEHAGRWIVAAGGLLGAAWATRETALVMAPIVVLAAWPVLRRGGRGWARLVGGIAFIPLFEVTVFGLAGRPLWPLLATPSAGSFRSPLDGWEATQSYIGLAVNAVVHVGSPLLLALPLVLVAVAVAVQRRVAAATVPGVWLAVGALYLEIGTLISVDKPVRFLTLLTVPVALLVAIALDGRLIALLVPLVAIVTVLAVTPRLAGGYRNTNVMLVSAVADAMRDLPRAPILTADYIWWAKLNAFLPSGRLPVARTTDGAHLDSEGRRAARRLDPLPVVSAYHGGYVVTGPVRETRAWPDNWHVVRETMRTQVPWNHLEPVVRVGRATVWRWPS